MQVKPILKHRGVRFSDEQWGRLEKQAEAMSKNNQNSKRVTASDVVRHAVDKMEAEDAMSEA